MARTTLKVPADFAERFREGVRDAQQAASDGLKDVVQFQKQSDSPNKREALREEEMQSLLTAVESQEGGIEVSADRWALERALAGCVIDAGGAVYGAAEMANGPRKWAEIRAASAELEFWVSASEAVA